jgi:hypothetical protein
MCVCVYLGVILSRPTAYCKVTIQHNHLNGKNVIQNQQYKCKNNIKFYVLLTVHLGLILVNDQLDAQFFF